MELSKRILVLNGLKEFNPMQLAVLKKNWKEKSIVVSSPTASGKTLVAELLALNCIVNKGKKVVYTCPLKALASEHFSAFKAKYSKALKIRAALSTGDLDSSSRHLANYDLIFGTYEKLDSLIRHRAEWLSSVGLLIIDEVHEIDSGRGATLEVTACKLRKMNPKMQVLALSATIPNASEIAKWIDAELVESNYRPVPLREGVYFNQQVKYKDSKCEEFDGENALLSIVSDTISKKKKQALIFANTRKSAESIAQQLSSLCAQSLSKNDGLLLKKDAEKALHSLESPTEQCRALASLLEKGVAFHHAGLLQKQRGIIEDAFRKNRVKLIAATPTLAAGINIPAHTVMLSSLYRFDAGGMVRLPVREVKQMLGRAGRPCFDKEGRGILIAKSELDADEIFEHFVNGEIEDVTSKLGIEPVLRMHLLSLVATNFVFDLNSIEQFFSSTFYALQYGELSFLLEKIRTIIKELEQWGFVEAEENIIEATPLGKRISELYLDPLTAHYLVKALSSRPKLGLLGYLFLFSQSFEFMPWLSVPKKKEPGLWEQMRLNEKQLPFDIEKEMYFDLDLAKKFNSALFLEEWVSEKSEQDIMRDFNTQPGIVHSKLRICDWLAYSSLEIAKLLKAEGHISCLSKLRKRIKYGVKEELLVLIEVRGIGRVRARRLWRARIRSIADLKNADLTDLSRILGQGVARQIKQNIGQK